MLPAFTQSLELIVVIRRYSGKGCDGGVGGGEEANFGVGERARNSEGPAAGDYVDGDRLHTNDSRGSVGIARGGGDGGDGDEGGGGSGRNGSLSHPSIIVASADVGRRRDGSSSLSSYHPVA